MRGKEKLHDLTVASIILMLDSVMNIRQDTHLVGTQYNWLGSAFYIGYLAAEYPVNRA
jgi:hypothetical protein